MEKIFEKDIGALIKKLARGWFELCLALGFICLFFSLLIYFTKRDYLEYASFLGGYSQYESLVEEGNMAYLGFQGIWLSLLMMLSSIVFAIPLYGFGIVVECAQKILASDTLFPVESTGNADSSQSPAKNAEESLDSGTTSQDG